ncbi:selenoneine biosynthesis selenosugar synthase SenB [Noviherbaspirillum sp. Root189]|uniref:selenoneine biosynthesis selenosugar synthase SenB n=1 Tax=Noviherbaspirillum sp. Root189 TaxID=1736487 RepID=UPI00070BB0FF|nr:selenoneine biosynthesis selenosugar synthase SenB [Noviherbaspirillum sp. Root189]KRB93798.1 glycosyl transferase family 1 [Noviherbaspirillum sp. Root189]
MKKQHVTIISPATANANNGNWQTASRWAAFLSSGYEVRVLEDWDGHPCNLMIALHARRSASSITRFSHAFPDRPLLVVLTGTDLYRDIVADEQARQSLRLASKLVVLQEAGLDQLDDRSREKACVIYQSAPPGGVAHEKKDKQSFDVIMIGHLRAEKDPLVFMQAAAHITHVEAERLRMIHVGGALDAELREQALATQSRHPHYRWLGNLPHAETLERLAASDIMVIASRMEGGANVIIEAVNCGVPVLASDIAGNRGMLGDDYAGYFAVGDSIALAALINRASHDAAFRRTLQEQCARRRPLFQPAREQKAVLQVVRELLLNVHTNAPELDTSTRPPCSR